MRRNIKRYRIEESGGSWHVFDAVMRERLRHGLARAEARAYADEWNARPWLRPAASAWAPVGDGLRPECDGHPAGPFDPMGATVYCDGTCSVAA